MQTFFSEDHRLHFPLAEPSGSVFFTSHERLSHVEHVLHRLMKRSFPGVSHPRPAEMAPVRRLSDAGVQEVLETASADGKAEKHGGDVISIAVPTQHQRLGRITRSVDERVGCSCGASEKAVTGGIWATALSSMASAEAAQRALAGGARAAFALFCPLVGHHETRDQRGGYCCLNDAAVAADMFVAAGASRVAIVEGDFHHGNSTQEVFYGRGDVLFASLRGDAMDIYPYDAGFADETGFGADEGGYAIEQVGVNTVNVRESFENT